MAIEICIMARELSRRACLDLLDNLDNPSQYANLRLRMLHDWVCASYECGAISGDRIAKAWVDDDANTL